MAQNTNFVPSSASPRSLLRKARNCAGHAGRRIPDGRRHGGVAPTSQDWAAPASPVQDPGGRAAAGVLHRHARTPRAPRTRDSLRELNIDPQAQHVQRHINMQPTERLQIIAAQGNHQKLAQCRTTAEPTQSTPPHLNASAVKHNKSITIQMQRALQ